MARTKTKSGSKVKTNCLICGKVVTKAGLIGHMAWSHGKDHRRPMLPAKVTSAGEARRKAKLYDILLGELGSEGAVDRCLALHAEALRQVKAGKCKCGGRILDEGKFWYCEQCGDVKEFKAHFADLQDQLSAGREPPPAHKAKRKARHKVKRLEKGITEPL